MTRKMVDQGPSLFDWASSQQAGDGTQAAVTLAAKGIVNNDGCGHDGHTSAPNATASIVDFLDRRETLPRFILCQPSPVAHIDRAIARKKGVLAPAPVIAFPRKHPASPGSYSPEPSRRQG